MRIWNDTDPRLLNRKHLLAEHREVHALLNDDHDWGTNPEYARFADMGEYGRALLVLRHELLRAAMNRRWPWRHAEANTETQRAHPTPLSCEDFLIMTPRMGAVLTLYERSVYLNRPTPAQAQRLFRGLMSVLSWPACRLDGGATTPWARDGISASEYLLVGDSWLRAKYHHKATTTKGH